MDKHLCLSRKCINQPASIWGWHFLWRPESDICLVNIGASLINTPDEGSHKAVDLHPIITLVTDLKSIIEVDMSCKKGDENFFYLNLNCNILSNS